MAAQGGGKKRGQVPDGGGETAEYERGDDLLAGAENDEELDEAGLTEDEDLDNDLDEDRDGEDLDEESLDDELQRVISAETQEWDAVEAAEAEADGPGSDGSAPRGLRENGSAIQSSLQTVDHAARTAFASGFARLRRWRPGFPVWLRFLTACVVIVSAIAAATASSLILYLSDIAHALKHGTVLTGVEQFLQTPNDGPQTILILGSDRRNGPQGGGAKYGNSDTTMLLRLDPNRNSITLMSIPRDLKVDIPGYGVNKINAAYSLGGPKLTLRTVRAVTGIVPNHIVNIDFTGFAKAVNAIGCVYVDVDRRYYIPPNTGVSQINLEPGYQALCGVNALAFARYRHTDTDIVRAARQQAFLREARAKLPPLKLFEDHAKLIRIFTSYTSSDINSADQVLQLLRLFLDLRGAQVKEIHFQSTLGPSFVTATPDQIHGSVSQFLGAQRTPGPVASPAPPGGQGNQPGKHHRASSHAPSSSVIPTSAGRQYGRSIAASRRGTPVFYPTLLEVGSQYAQPPRAYMINGKGDGSPPNGQRAAYKWVFQLPGFGDYYGFEGTRWQNPPILSNPSETKSIGGRDYKLYYDGDRLRMVAWQTGRGSFWVSNSYIETVPNADMLKIAEGFRQLPGT